MTGKSSYSTTRNRAHDTAAILSIPVAQFDVVLTAVGEYVVHPSGYAAPAPACCTRLLRRQREDLPIARTVSLCCTKLAAHPRHSPPQAVVSELGSAGTPVEYIVATHDDTTRPGTFDGSSSERVAAAVRYPTGTAHSFTVTRLEVQVTEAQYLEGRPSPVTSAPGPGAAIEAFSADPLIVQTLGKSDSRAPEALLLDEGTDLGGRVLEYLVVQNTIEQRSRRIDAIVTFTLDGATVFDVTVGAK